MILEFTKEEANLLISLLDEATKAKGLSVAQGALFFLDKIQKAATQSKVDDKSDITT